MKLPHTLLKQYKYQSLFLAGGVLLLAVTVLSFAYVLNKTHLKVGPAYAANGDISWRVFDGGIDDPGSNPNETYITTGNAANLHQLWQAPLPASADNAAVEEANVSTSQGLMDLVFVNTVKGNLVAFNASTGAKIWEADPSSANYNGQGTKSAPAIDSSGSYIYAYGLDGYVHKYNIGNGTEVSGTGFPAQVTLLPNNIEKESASLNIANGYLYATISGNDGDYGHYVGHVVAVNLSNGTKTVWNSECSNITVLEDATSGDSNYCSNSMSGIWARPGVKVDPVTGNVFVATGNGNYNANSGGNNWGDSIIELKPDLSQIVDSYTPATYSSLDSADADLGSTAPVILPTQSGSNTPYMLVQAGKDHIVRLLNRANLSGQSAPRHTGGELQTITISDEVHEQPAVWVDGSGNTWVFVTDESGDLYAYKVVTSAGVSSLSQVYTKNIGVSSSPFVANGVLYLDGNNILALNATTGATLFNSTSLGIGLNQHWESPFVANGMLFTPSNSGTMYALYIPGVTPVPNVGPAFIGSQLTPGQNLYGGQYLASSNVQFKLAMQGDGNLVLYGGPHALWATNTNNNPGAFLAVQGDGNIVLYSSAGRSLWATNTNGKGLAQFLLQSDGNLVAYPTSGGALWASNTDGHQQGAYFGSDHLTPGQQLVANQYLTSSDKRYGLLMQADGNLVLFSAGYHVLWASNTVGNPGAFLGAQGDGNVVIYSNTGRPLWATNTNGKGLAQFLLQSDGNLVAYSSTVALWATGTNGEL